jgi:hypothetical protein
MTLPVRKENIGKGQRGTYGGAKLLGELFFPAWFIECRYVDDRDIGPRKINLGFCWTFPSGKWDWLRCDS